MTKHRRDVNIDGSSQAKHGRCPFKTKDVWDIDYCPRCAPVEYARLHAKHRKGDWDIYVEWQAGLGVVPVPEFAKISYINSWD